jgi:hypothetical protein
VRYLVASALLLACAIVLLWREVVATPAEVPSMRSNDVNDVIDGASRSNARPSIALPSPRSESPTAPMATAASPPGGVRAWSPTAAPLDGPDPFAAVPEIRTADDTGAGLTEATTR